MAWICNVTTDAVRSPRPVIAVGVGAAWPDNDASGPVQSVRNVARALSAEFRFELYARNGAPGEAALVADGHREETDWGGITYCSVGWRGAHRLADRITDVAPSAIWLNSLWDREFTLPILLARRTGRLSRVPVLLSTRGEMSEGALALKSQRKTVMLKALRLADALEDVTLHVTGALEMADAARMIPEAQRVDIDNVRLLDPATRRLPHDKSDVLGLLFLGRISPVKGLHNALAALARVKSPSRLTVCGPVHDVPYWKSCEALIADLPDHCEVTVTGPIANSEAADYYAAADLFLNPSTSENFGHTIFESLQAGTPVLTGLKTPWNGLEEDRAGFNCPSDDPAAIAAAIERYAALDTGMRTQWHDAARRRAERFVHGQSATSEWKAWFGQGAAGSPSE